MPHFNLADLNSVYESIPKEYRGHVLLGMLALMVVLYVAEAFGFIRFACGVAREIWKLIFGRIGR